MNGDSVDLPDHQKVETTSQNGHLSLNTTWMSLRFQILPELHLNKEVLDVDAR